METEVLNLELVEKESEKLVIRGDLKQELADQLAPVLNRLPLHKQRADTLTVKTEQDAAQADSYLVDIAADEKIVVAEAGAIECITSAANKFHKMLTRFRGQFTTPLTEAKRTIKGKRDAWTAEQQRKAEAERARLQAIEDERIRKQREAQEALARAQREKEEAARRAEEEARRKAAAEQDAAKRKALEAEAERKRKEAEAAAAKAEAREERAATTIAAQIHVEAPAARKGARMKWYVQSTDKLAVLKAIVANPTLLGYVTIEETKLASTKNNNTTFEVAGVTFVQKVI
jgi:hypothetical protein